MSEAERDAVKAVVGRWRDRLRAARNRGRFTNKDMGKAADFKTCSVGEALKGKSPLQVYPSIYNLRGKKLHELGMSFYDAVRANALTEATRIHKEIREVLSGS